MKRGKWIYPSVKTFESVKSNAKITVKISRGIKEVTELMFLPLFITNIF